VAAVELTVTHSPEFRKDIVQKRYNLTLDKLPTAGSFFDTYSLINTNWTLEDNTTPTIMLDNNDKNTQNF